jgi:hypothetical protein
MLTSIDDIQFIIWYLYTTTSQLISNTYDFIRYDFPQGIQRIKIWFPIVWRDRDWDWTFIAILMKKKLELMAKHEVEYGHHYDSLRDAKKQRICAAILGRLIDVSFYGNQRERRFDTLRLSKQSLKWEDAKIHSDQSFLFNLMNKNFRQWWD